MLPGSGVSFHFANTHTHTHTHTHTRTHTRYVLREGEVERERERERDLREREFRERERERTACCGTACSLPRPGSARNGLQVRVSIGTQCSHQQRQRYKLQYSRNIVLLCGRFPRPALDVTPNTLLPLRYSVSLALPLPLPLLSLFLHCVIWKSEPHAATSPARPKRQHRDQGGGGGGGGEES